VADVRGEAVALLVDGPLAARRASVKTRKGGRTYAHGANPRRATPRVMGRWWARLDCTTESRVDSRDTLTHCRVMSGWPVPTNLFCRCSQFLDRETFTLKRSLEAIVLVLDRKVR